VQARSPQTKLLVVYWDGARPPGRATVASKAGRWRVMARERP